jgi:hypothetical protein
MPLSLIAHALGKPDQFARKRHLSLAIEMPETTHLGDQARHILARVSDEVLIGYRSWPQPTLVGAGHIHVVLVIPL